ncbi:MAG: hypothetical protein ACRD0O_19750 [Acidimicrobiia bacterium]
MVDRVDLLIAVIGIVVSIVGSSTALWVTLSKKPDKEDLARLESRLETDLARVEGKLDALIMRFVPDHVPHPGQ